MIYSTKIYSPIWNRVWCSLSWVQILSIYLVRYSFHSLFYHSTYILTVVLSIIIIVYINCSSNNCSSTYWYFAAHSAFSRFFISQFSSNFPGNNYKITSNHREWTHTIKTLIHPTVTYNTNNNRKIKKKEERNTKEYVNHKERRLINEANNLDKNSGNTEHLSVPWPAGDIESRVVTAFIDTVRF